jgi:hypothetical protein
VEPASRKSKTPKIKSEVVTTTTTTTQIINDDEPTHCKKSFHHGVDDNNCDQSDRGTQFASIWPRLLHLEEYLVTVGTRIYKLSSLLRQWVVWENASHLLLKRKTSRWLPTAILYRVVVLYQFECHFVCKLLKWARWGSSSMWIALGTVCHTT